MPQKIYSVTFDNGMTRVGSGRDPIAAICNAVLMANVEAEQTVGLDPSAPPIKKVSSRNVVLAELVLPRAKTDAVS